MPVTDPMLTAVQIAALNRYIVDAERCSTPMLADKRVELVDRILRSRASLSKPQIAAVDMVGVFNLPVTVVARRSGGTAEGVTKLLREACDVLAAHYEEGA